MSYSVYNSGRVNVLKINTNPTGWYQFKSHTS